MPVERSNREIAAVRERPVDAAAVRGNRGSVVAVENDYNLMVQNLHELEATMRSVVGEDDAVGDL